MPHTNDHELLIQFAQDGCEPAFAALVERYANLVYSTALRFTGKSHHAEEITQAVFIILSRKAGTLSSRIVLSGWLYQTTRLTAANFIKGEIRRQRREQEAYMQSTLKESSSSDWEQLAPLLDDAMGRLGEADRNLILLRFFQNKTSSETAAALELSEAAVYKRANRALDKLRRFFAKREVTAPTSAIVAAISANSTSASPMNLAGIVSAITCPSNGILVKSTMKTMTWLKIKFTAVIAASAVIIGGATLVGWPKESALQNPAASPNSMLIVPFQSVGNVTAGMTTNEVEAILGKPEKWMGKVMIYDRQLGMSVIQSAMGVTVIFGGDSLPTYPGVKKFKGRTKEGIGMESTRAEIINAFGQPSKATPGSGAQEQLEYPGLGLTFVLDQGKVFHVTVDFRKR